MSSAVTVDNPYPPGQCTWFVKQACPWVPWFPGSGGNAGEWLTSARAAGFATGSTPAVGAIAVWEGGVGGASPLGHVAVVTAVSPLTVAGEDWPTGAGPITYVVGTAGAPGAPSGFILEDKPMTPDERTDLAGALVELAYAALPDRDADADPGGRDYWRGRFAQPGGMTAAAQAFVHTPEVTADMAAEASEHTAGNPAAGG